MLSYSPPQKKKRNKIQNDPPNPQNKPPQTIHHKTHFFRSRFYVYKEKCHFLCAIMILFTPHWIWFYTLTFNWQLIVCCLGTATNQKRFVFSQFGTVLFQFWKTATSFPKTVCLFCKQRALGQNIRCTRVHCFPSLSTFYAFREAATVPHV